MTKLTYGDFTVDTADLPSASVDALLSRGFAHFMGNETASRVSAHFGDEIKTASPEDKASAKLTFQTEAFAKLQAGTVGASGPRGPRGTGVDTVIRELAEKEVRGILKANNLVMPTGDKTVALGSGDNVLNLTRADLISRRIANHGDRLRKEAEAEMKRINKAAESANDL